MSQGGNRGYRLGGDYPANANPLSQPPRSAVRWDDARRQQAAAAQPQSAASHQPTVATLNTDGTSSQYGQHTNYQQQQGYYPQQQPGQGGQGLPPQQQRQGGFFSRLFNRQPLASQQQQPNYYQQQAAGYHNAHPNPNAYRGNIFSSASTGQYDQNAQGYYDRHGYGVTAIPMQPAFNEDGTPPSIWQRLFPRSRWYALTTVIAWILVILFITELSVGAGLFGSAFASFSDNNMGGPNTCTLVFMGAKFTPLITSNPPLDVWRLITPIFLHAGFIHIIFNLWMFIWIGYVLEDRLYNPKYQPYWSGGILYISVFLFTGIMGNLFSAVLTPIGVSVGASGALFGLLGFQIVYLIRNWPVIPNNHMEACMLIFFLVINLLLGVGTNSVDNYAHLGGLIGGIVMGLWLCPVLIQRFDSPQTDTFIKAFGCILTLGIFAIMLGILFGTNVCSKEPYPYSTWCKSFNSSTFCKPTS